MRASADAPEPGTSGSACCGTSYKRWLGDRIASRNLDALRAQLVVRHLVMARNTAQLLVAKPETVLFSKAVTLDARECRPPPRWADSSICFPVILAGCLADAGQLQMLQRIRHCLQVSLRRWRYLAVVLEIHMTEQDLDRAQVCSGLEQVRRPAVAQGVGVTCFLMRA